jgi:molybdate transport system substrate-binding protein
MPSRQAMPWRLLPMRPYRGMGDQSLLTAASSSGNRMTSRSGIHARIVVGLVAIALLDLALSTAQASDVRVYTSGAPADIQKGLVQRFRDTSGHRLVLTSGTLNAIQERLLASEAADAVVLPVPTVDTLDKAGKLRAGSRIGLARVGIGVAVRQGAPVPDVSTVEALRKTLLAARSIVHPDPKGGGFTGAHIDRVFERLGIAEAVRPKVTLMFAIGGGTAAVAKGDTEIGLFNVSEILPVSGVALAGAFPAELQNYITFAGAVSVDSPAPDAAAAYLRLLAGARDAWAAGGFEMLANSR